MTGKVPIGLLHLMEAIEFVLSMADVLPKDTIEQTREYHAETLAKINEYKAASD